MTDGGPQVPPGWYDDPYQPSQLRYWDGQEWTENFHSQTGADSGGLPNIGEWFGSTVSAIGAYGIPAAALAIGAELIQGLVLWASLYWALDGLAIIDEEFVGSAGGFALRLIPAVLVLVLLRAFTWLAINRFMQRAHLHQEPSIGEALSRAAKRLPRLVAVYLVLALAVVAVVLLLAAVVAAGGDGGIILAVVVLLAAIPLMVFAWVKLSFLSAAAAAAPDEHGLLATSAGVSKGRFWGVLGRLVVLAVLLSIVTGVISSVMGGVAQPVDQQVLEDTFVVVGDDIVVSDFAFRDVLPASSSLVVFAIVSAVLNGLSGLVSTSGVMRLYLDSGAPSAI